MTRWHLPYCEAPDVFVDESNIPECRACGSLCPATAELLAMQGNCQSGLTLPPDEPMGQMNLSWPKDVPYVNKKEIDLEAQHSAHKLSESPPPSLPPSAARNFPVYGDTLRPNEIRLVCLYAVPRRDCAVHLTLETFTTDNRPEYETVSYQWGGENGDSTPCKPIFIGPYWDVVLQTQNCWSMLKFARPWRGIRMMWVDAICINQNNLVERGAQVANMREIYGNGSRVMVFLGDDIITPTMKYPTYSSLDELSSWPVALSPRPSTRVGSEAINLSGLLQRAYFSRVWVIQELLVSPGAVFRIGNIDFRADAEIIQRISKGSSTPFKWNTTSAPWVQQLAQKSLNPARTKDAFSLAALTSRCKASDPRDRIFAINQLLVDASLRKNLYVDYTISFRHFSIGFFAHSLLVSRKYSFLDQAGLSSEHQEDAGSAKPTWVPECRSHENWQRAFVNAITSTSGSGSISWRPRTDLQVYLDERSTVALREVIPEVSGKDFSPGSQLYPCVDATTGALELNLTRLLVFTERPQELEVGFGCYHLYAVNPVVNGTAPFCLLAWTPLRAQPGDYLFAFTTENEADAREGYNTIYLILRPKTTTGEQLDVPTFELVTTRVGLCSGNAWLARFQQRLDNPRSLSEQEWPRLRNLGFLRLRHVQASVAFAINNVLRVLVEARHFIFTPKQLIYAECLPNGTDETSRTKASRICVAFLRHGRRDHIEFQRGLEKICRENCYRPPSQGGLHIAQSMRDFLVRNGLESLLDALRSAYDPPLTMTEMEEVIRDGPTEEQKHIGLPKYVSGCRVEGSVHRVRIV